MYMFWKFSSASLGGLEVLDDLYLQAPSGDGRGAWKQARSRAPVTGHRQPGGPANASRGVGGVTPAHALPLLVRRLRQGVGKQIQNGNVDEPPEKV